MASKLFSFPFVRLKWMTVVTRTRTASKTLFSRYLLATNVTISTTLSGVGDTLQQHYEIFTGEEETWNRKRSSDMAVTGAVIGVICHYWYIALDQRLPGRAFRTIVKKLLVDQIIFSPFLICVFFGTAGILERSR